MAERWSLAPARLLTVSQHVEAYIVRPVDFATKRAETPSVLACGGRACPACGLCDMKGRDTERGGVMRARSWPLCTVPASCEVLW